MDESVVRACMLRLLKEGLGLDITDPNLRDTPERVARMYCRELLCNSTEEFNDLRWFPNKHEYNQIVSFDHIFFSSVCSHHLLPFTGYAWLLYIPEERLVGASKPARLVDHYARRLQLQEHLCHQVMNRFVEVVCPKGAMVYMRAIHGCMKCRGVRQYGGAGMSTSVIHGVFQRLEVKMEALDIIKLSLIKGK